MATTVRASSIATDAASSAVSVAAPTGTAAGDLVTVIVHVNVDTTTIADNNGSTPFDDDGSFTQTSGGARITVFSRRIQTGDPSTYAFTLSGAVRWTAVAVTWQSPHASVIYDVVPAATGSAVNDTTGTAPDITTVNANAIHCAIFGADASANTITGTPTGYTVQENGGVNQNTAFTYKVIASPGATGAQTFTQTASDGWLGVSFAIRDVGGATSILRQMMMHHGG